MGAEPLAVWLEPLPVHELMHAPVATVTPDTPACEAARLLGTRKIRHLPVVDHDGRLVGIVTDRDLRQAVFHPAVQARLGTMPGPSKRRSGAWSGACGRSATSPHPSPRISASRATSGRTRASPATRAARHHESLAPRPPGRRLAGTTWWGWARSWLAWHVRHASACSSRSVQPLPVA
jgi:hypothetical protein